MHSETPVSGRIHSSPPLYPSMRHPARASGKLISTPTLHPSTSVLAELYVSAGNADAAGRCTVRHVPAVLGHRSAARDPRHDHVAVLHVYAVRVRMADPFDVHVTHPAARGPLTVRCARCAATVVEVRETVPYIGPHGYVVELRDVQALRCGVCGTGQLVVPGLRALDVLIRVLAVEQPHRTPQLAFRNGSWRVVGWSTRDGVLPGAAV
jgi:hypothetical protein